MLQRIIIGTALFCLVVSAVFFTRSEPELTAKVACTSINDTNCCWGHEYETCSIEAQGGDLLEGVCDYNGACNPDAILCLSPTDPKTGPTNYVCMKPAKCKITTEDYGPTQYSTREQCEEGINNPADEYCAEDEFGNWTLYMRDMKFNQCVTDCPDQNEDGICDDTVSCSSNADCDDGNKCTEDQCFDGKCEYSNVHTACDDGIACTIDTCVVSDGECEFIPDSSVCAADDDECTEAVCSTSEGCMQLEIPDCPAPECVDSSDCSDGNLCTDDVCTEEGTCENPSITCEPSDACHVAECLPDEGCKQYDRTEDICPDPDECTESQECVVEDGVATCKETEKETAECICPTDFELCEGNGLDGEPICCNTPLAWCLEKEATSRVPAHWICATNLPDDDGGGSGANSGGDDSGDNGGQDDGGGGPGGTGDTGDNGDTTTITTGSSAGNSVATSTISTPPPPSSTTSAATSAPASSSTTTTSPPSSPASSAGSSASSVISFSQISSANLSSASSGLSSVASSASSELSFSISVFSSALSSIDSVSVSSAQSSVFAFSLSTFSFAVSSANNSQNTSSVASFTQSQLSQASDTSTATTSFASALSSQFMIAHSPSSIITGDDDDDGDGDNDDGQVGNQPDDDDGDGDNDDGIPNNQRNAGEDDTIAIVATTKSQPTLVAAAAVCGDGTLSPGEECDDNNRRDNDGCSSSCLLEVGICGDGIVQKLLGEQCEQSSHDTSLPYSCVRCQFVSQSCGDGTIDPGEECDNGNQNSTSPDASCRPDCRLGTCGDGILDSAEQCDDGNRLSGDGCDRYCVLEADQPTAVASEVTDIPFPTQQLSDSPFNLALPNQPNLQQIPYQLPLAQLQPLIQNQAPVGDTGPAAVAVVATGAAAGFGWMRKKKR